MKIGHKTIEHCIHEVSYKLTEYQPEMNKAYVKGAETLTVSLSLKISPSNKGNKVITGIKFVTDQVDDKNTSFVDEDQLSLLDGVDVRTGEIVILHPKGGSRFGRPGQGLYRGIG